MLNNISHDQKHFKVGLYQGHHFSVANFAKFRSSIFEIMWHYISQDQGNTVFCMVSEVFHSGIKYLFI